MDFTGFLGNDAVKARLSGAFASGRVAHSYLLCGPAGSGKHTLTRILSAAMQDPLRRLLRLPQGA